MPAQQWRQTKKTATSGVEKNQKATMSLLLLRYHFSGTKKGELLIPFTEEMMPERVKQKGP
jgi:hypothetical protein